MTPTPPNAALSRFCAWCSAGETERDSKKTPWKLPGRYKIPILVESELALKVHPGAFGFGALVFFF